jgi:hypothetical protein
MIEIPDVNFKISDDGNYLTLEQGQLEPTRLVLHRIHVKHIAGLMHIGAEVEEGDVQLSQFLERINAEAQELHDLLANIPSFPPQDSPSEEVVLAAKLLGTTNLAIALWGVDGGKIIITDLPE